MKKFCLSVLILVVTISGVFAKPIWGFIYYQDGTVKKVLLRVPWVEIRDRPDFHKLQKKISYQHNFRSSSLYPWEATGFLFVDEIDTIRMVSFTPMLGFEDPFFAKLENEGRLMLFKYFLPADPEPVYLIQDRNSVLMVDKINFKNFIEDYAQTCPQYFEGLKVGQNINEELSLFISNYNQNCVYE